MKVWDIWVRLFHWAFALAILFLLVSGKTGFEFTDWHRVVGEIALALIVFRLVWGFVGSSTAKLLPLFKSPRSALRHLRDLLLTRKVAPSVGHNAAGGYAVLLLLISTSVQAITGLFIADEDEFVEGRFYSAVDSGLAAWFYDIHYLNSKILIVLVVLHVVMVFFYLLVARVNLIVPMLTGRMTTDPVQARAPHMQRWWIGLTVAMATAALFYLVFGS